jgi:hypothetical protein
MVHGFGPPIFRDTAAELSGHWRESLTHFACRTSSIRSMSIDCVDSSAPDLCPNMSDSFSTATGALHAGKDSPIQAEPMRWARRSSTRWWCSELGISAVTRWVCPTENLKRLRAEVSGILGAVEAKIGALAQAPWIHERRVPVKAACRLGLLPLSTVAVIRRAEKAMADYDAMTLTIAVAYGDARRSSTPFAI